MANYSNMPPTATAGAFSPAGMMPTNAWANNAPPMYTSPAYTSPAYTDPYSMGMYYGPKPVLAAAVACCGAGSIGIILVLFILLVIITRTIL
jgi:hypothetical protein